MSERGKNELKGASKALLEQKKNELKSKRLETKRIREDLRAAKNRADRRELRERKERAEREASRLEEELSTVKHERAGFLLETRRGPRVAQGAETGALPDFAIIGQRRSGTTFLYHLLSLHPHVQPAVTKEPHFFGVYFDEGVEWYRQYFPKPKQIEGRTTITGEATPLMANRLAPERMAGVIPNARLIALLRDPVDRTYSDYQHVVGKGREERGFEEAIGLDENGPDDNSPYVVRSRYVDQLQRWSEFYSRERTLVLKSEELYERPAENLKVVLDFLGLPEWEPDASEVVPRKQNKGAYTRGGMEPATRRKLEGYFAPHNQRLYEYLGRDFGW